MHISQIVRKYFDIPLNYIVYPSLSQINNNLVKFLRVAVSVYVAVNIDFGPPFYRLPDPVNANCSFLCTDFMGYTPLTYFSVVSNEIPWKVLIVSKIGW